MERLVSRRRPLVIHREVTDLPIAGRNRKLTGRFSVTNDGEDDHGGLYNFDTGMFERSAAGSTSTMDGYRLIDAHAPVVGDRGGRGKPRASA